MLLCEVASGVQNHRQTVRKESGNGEIVAPHGRTPFLPPFGAATEYEEFRRLKPFRHKPTALLYVGQLLFPNVFLCPF